MRTYLLSTFVFVFSLGCAQSTVKPEATSPDSEPTWAGRMQELSETVNELLPYVFDDEKFDNPTNTDFIQKKTQRLSDLAHGLETMSPQNKSAPATDPALNYLASQLKEDLVRVNESLSNRHYDYARSVLRTSISYCISCHTQSNLGPQFSIKTSDRFASSLHPMERARYYTATRQYDDALTQYLDILNDPNTGRLRPFDIEKSARSALGITVRVKGDIEKSIQIVKKVLNKPETPLFVKNDAETWLSSLNEWKREKPFSPSNESAIKNKVRDLLKKAKVVQRYSSDMRGDIYYLRASALIHTYLNSYKNPKDLAEMLYLAGQCYNALKDLGFWTLHEMYFEKCIRVAPHSELARKCYEGYEQSIVLGYSGSAGLFLPTSVIKHLSELRRLANP